MKKKAKGKSIYKKQDNIAGYVMLAPWMFGFLLMWFIPMLISIYYSFTNFNLLNDAKVIGFVTIYVSLHRMRHSDRRSR